MLKYTGYGEDNTILNMLEYLKWSSQGRANDLMRPDDERRVAEATANAYNFTQLLIMKKERFNG
jgi:hypothetical protein